MSIYGDTDKFSILNLVNLPWIREDLSEPEQGYRYSLLYDEYIQSWPLLPQMTMPFAKICIERGTVNFPFTAKYYIKDGNNENEYEEDLLEEILDCPLECCQYYEVYSQSTPIPPPGVCAGCCYDIFVKYTTPDVPEPCQVGRVKVYNANPPFQLWLDANPYYTNENGTFLMSFQLGLSQPIDCKSFKFEFYDSEDNLLCDEHTIAECCDIGWPPEGKIPNSDIAKLNNIEILHFYFYPNPTDGSINICYELSNSVNVNLVLCNSIGGNPIVIFDGEISYGLNTQKFTFSNMPLGMYFVRLTAGNQTRYLPIINNK